MYQTYRAIPRKDWKNWFSEAQIGVENPLILSKYKQVGILYRFKARRIKINSEKVSEKSVRKKCKGFKSENNSRSCRVIDKQRVVQEWTVDSHDDFHWGSQVSITDNNPLWNYPRPGLSDQKISLYLAQPSRISRAVHTKTWTQLALLTREHWFRPQASFRLWARRSDLSP